jgi:phosphoribosylamine-glycine ligase
VLQVFHAGTTTDSNGQLVANGGRVLAVTALGKDVAEAQANAYKVGGSTAPRYQPLHQLDQRPAPV